MIWVFIFLLAFAPYEAIETGIFPVNYDSTSKTLTGQLQAYYAGEWYKVENAPLFLWIEDTNGNLQEVCYMFTGTDGTFEADLSAFSNIRSVYLNFCSPDQDINSENQSACLPEDWTRPVNSCDGSLDTPAGDVVLRDNNGDVYEDWVNWGYLSSRFSVYSIGDLISMSGDEEPFLGLMLVGALVGAMAIAQNPSLLGWFSFQQFFQRNAPPGWYRGTSGIRGDDTSMMTLPDDGSNANISNTWALQEALGEAAQLSAASVELKKEAAEHKLAAYEDEDKTVDNRREAIGQLDEEDRFVGRHDYGAQERGEGGFPQQTHHVEGKEFHEMAASFYGAMATVTEILGKPVEWITQAINFVFEESGIARLVDKDVSTISMKLKAFFLQAGMKVLGEGFLGYNLQREMNVIAERETLNKAVEAAIKMGKDLETALFMVRTTKYDVNNDGYLNEEELERMKKENPLGWALVQAYLKDKKIQKTENGYKFDVDDFYKEVSKSMESIRDFGKDLTHLLKYRKSLMELAKNGEIDLEKAKNNLQLLTALESLGLVTIKRDNNGEIKEIKVAEGKELTVEGIENAYKEKVEEQFKTFFQNSDALTQALFINLAILAADDPNITQELTAYRDLLIDNRKEKGQMATEEGIDAKLSIEKIADNVFKVLNNQEDANKFEAVIGSIYSLTNPFVTTLSFDVNNDGKIDKTDLKEIFKNPELKKEFQKWLTEKIEEYKATGKIDKFTEKLLLVSYGGNQLSDIKDKLRQDATAITDDVVNNVMNKDIEFDGIVKTSNIEINENSLDKLEEQAKTLQTSAEDLVWGAKAVIDSILEDKTASDSEKIAARNLLTDINLLAIGGASDSESMMYRGLLGLAINSKALSINKELHDGVKAHFMRPMGDTLVDRTEALENLATVSGIGLLTQDALNAMEPGMEAAKQASYDYKFLYGDSPNDILDGAKHVLGGKYEKAVKEIYEELEEKYGKPYEELSEEEQTKFMKEFREKVENIKTEEGSKLGEKVSQEFKENEKKAASVAGLSITGVTSQIVESLTLGEVDSKAYDYLSGKEIDPASYYAATEIGQAVKFQRENETAVYLPVNGSEERKVVENLYKRSLIMNEIKLALADGVLTKEEYERIVNQYGDEAKNIFTAMGLGEGLWKRGEAYFPLDTKETIGRGQNYIFNKTKEDLESIGVSLEDGEKTVGIYVPLAGSDNYVKFTVNPNGVDTNLVNENGRKVEEERLREIEKKRPELKDKVEEYKLKKAVAEASKDGVIDGNELVKISQILLEQGKILPPTDDEIRDMLSIPDNQQITKEMRNTALSKKALSYLEKNGYVDKIQIGQSDSGERQNTLGYGIVDRETVDSLRREVTELSNALGITQINLKTVSLGTNNFETEKSETSRIPSFVPSSASSKLTNTGTTDITDVMSESELRKAGQFFDAIDLEGFGYDSLGKYLMFEAMKLDNPYMKGGIINKGDEAWDKLAQELGDKAQPTYLVIDAKEVPKDAPPGTLVKTPDKVYFIDENGQAIETSLTSEEVPIKTFALTQDPFAGENIERIVSNMVKNQQFSHSAWGWTPEYTQVNKTEKEYGISPFNQVPMLSERMAAIVPLGFNDPVGIMLYKKAQEDSKEGKIAQTQLYLLSMKGSALLYGLGIIKKDEEKSPDQQFLKALESNDYTPYAIGNPNASNPAFLFDKGTEEGKARLATLIQETGILKDLEKVLEDNIITLEEYQKLKEKYGKKALEAFGIKMTLKTEEKDGKKVEKVEVKFDRDKYEEATSKNPQIAALVIPEKDREQLLKEGKKRIILGRIQKNLKEYSQPTDQ